MSKDMEGYVPKKCPNCGWLFWAPPEGPLFCSSDCEIENEKEQKEK